MYDRRFGSSRSSGGEIALYEYVTASNTRFYYSEAGAAPELLVYRTYFRQEGNDPPRFIELKTYLRQINGLVGCPATTVAELRDVPYKRKDLAAVFENLNACVSSPATVYENRPQEKLLNLYASAGFGTSGVTGRFEEQFFDGRAFADLDLGRQSYLTYGLELEFFVPKLNQRFAVAASPRVTTFTGQDTKEVIYVGVANVVDSIGVQFANYRDITAPVLLRYYAIRGKALSVDLALGIAAAFPIPNQDALRLRPFDASSTTEPAISGSVAANLRIGFRDRIYLTGTFIGNQDPLRLSTLELARSRADLMLQVRLF